jgi:hypothetical protein
MAGKKLILLACFFSIFSSLIMAQKESEPNFYVKIFGGYGILTPGAFKLTSTSTTSFSVGSTGLGAGLHFGGGLGYILNDFLNLGVDAEYLKGNDLTASSTYSGVLGSGSSHSKIPYSVLSIIPNITFKALSKPGYLIYTRIGILITAQTKSSSIVYDSSDLIINHPNPIVASNTNTTYTYSVNVGVQAALGLQFHITGNLRGFVELVGNYLPITPTSSTAVAVINYYNSGPTFVSTSTTTTQTSYKKSGNTGNNEQASMAYNVNYIGLNIGIALRL